MLDFYEEEAIEGCSAATVVAQGGRRLRWASAGPTSQNSWANCRIEIKRKRERGGGPK
jgi:hypothetical protein